MIWPRDEPLTVQYNESNNQKYLTIPSANTTKPFNEIEEGQKIFPIAVSKDWNKEWKPLPAQIYELLDEAEWLLETIAELALKYDQEMQEGEDTSKPVEELAWLSESMTELINDKTMKYKERLEDEYYVHSSELPEDMWGEKTIKSQHGIEIVKKYSQLVDHDSEKEDELLDQHDEIEGFDTKGTEVTVNVKDGDSPTVRLTQALTDEDCSRLVAEFVSNLVEIYDEREEEFRAWAEEELGYEHRMTSNNLGFHQFFFNDYIVEIPMVVREIGDIQVYSQD